MCHCCLYFIKKDHFSSVSHEFVLILFGGIFSSVGLSAVPFKRCLMKSLINFHWTVYIISVINVFIALNLIIVYCKYESNEKILLKKVYSIFCLFLSVLSLILGIFLFVFEIKGISNCGQTYIVQSELTNMINKTDKLTFWNVYGTYVCDFGLCVFNLAAIFFCVINLLYLFTGTETPDELLHYFENKNREVRNEINNRNNRNAVVIISERTHYTNTNEQQ